jgi:hypothetical protein
MTGMDLVDMGRVNIPGHPCVQIYVRLGDCLGEFSRITHLQFINRLPDHPFSPFSFINRRPTQTPTDKKLLQIRQDQQDLWDLKVLKKQMTSMTPPHWGMVLAKYLLALDSDPQITQIPQILYRK